MRDAHKVKKEFYTNIGFIDEETKRRMETMGVEKRAQLSTMEKEIAQKKALEKIEHQRTLEREKRARNHEAILRQKKEYRERHREEILAKQREARKKVA